MVSLLNFFFSKFDGFEVVDFNVAEQAFGCDALAVSVEGAVGWTRLQNHGGIHGYAYRITWKQRLPSTWVIVVMVVVAHGVFTSSSM